MRFVPRANSHSCLLRDKHFPAVNYLQAACVVVNLAAVDVICLGPLGLCAYGLDHSSYVQIGQLEVVKTGVVAVLSQMRENDTRAVVLLLC